MAAVYPKIREQLISWALNQNAPAGLAFYVMGVDADYTYNAAHVNLTSVPAGARITSEKLLTGVTYVNGILDADDQRWIDMTPGDVIRGFVIYLKSGGGDTWLVCYLDTSIDGSIPQTVDSTIGDIIFNASGICKI